MRVKIPFSNLRDSERPGTGMARTASGTVVQVPLGVPSPSSPQAQAQAFKASRGQTLMVFNEMDSDKNGKVRLGTALQSTCEGERCDAAACDPEGTQAPVQRVLRAVSYVSGVAMCMARLEWLAAVFTLCRSRGASWRLLLCRWAFRWSRRTGCGTAWTSASGASWRLATGGPRTPSATSSSSPRGTCRSTWAFRTYAPRWSR